MGIMDLFEQISTTYTRIIELSSRLDSIEKRLDVIEKKLDSIIDISKDPVSANDVITEFADREVQKPPEFLDENSMNELFTKEEKLE